MSVRSKLILFIGVIVLIFSLVFIFWPIESKKTEKKIIKTVPASVVIIPTQKIEQVDSSTGAKSTVLDDSQYREQMLSFELRQICPVKNDYFEITYDYKTDKFVVTIAPENMETFLQWKRDTGYNFISEQYWVIKND